MEKDPLDHVNRVKDRLKHGREILEGLKEIRPYPLPGVTANEEQLTLDPPKPDDKFYVATDERDPVALKVIADNGAIFLDDLKWPVGHVLWSCVSDQDLIIDQRLTFFTSGSLYIEQVSGCLQ